MSNLLDDEKKYLAESPRCEDCGHLAVFHYASEINGENLCGLPDCDCPYPALDTTSDTAQA